MPRYCIHEGCKTRATYGYENASAMYCNRDKKTGMIDLNNRNKLCQNCGTRAGFGFKGQKPTRCFDHLETGMIDLVRKKCLTCKKTTAIFGMKDGKALYCFKCKTDEMVDIYNKAKNCEICNNTRANFGYKGQKPIRCKDDIEEGMIDLTFKKCEKCGEKKAKYGFKGKWLTRCEDHIESGMIDLRNINKLCKTCNEKRASFGLEGGKAEYCFNCKADTMVDVLGQLCKTPLCGTHCRNKYEGYCVRCYMYTYPDRPISRNYKTKEKTVVDYILECYPNYTWLKDKVIPDSCSLKRPDLMVDFGHQVIIIEVDENKHIAYECENNRMMQLWQAVGERNIVFIRFNPDRYKKDDVKIPSPWGLHQKSNILIVKDKKEWTFRLNTLTQELDYWINHKSKKSMTFKYLFYNT